MVIINGFTAPTDHDVLEATNTLEDMKEWMEWDIQNETIDSATGNTYLYNIEKCISILDR